MNATDKIITKTPSLFRVDDNFKDSRFMRVRIAVMHSGENLNHSSFSTKVIRDAKDTFADIAVLANIVRYIDSEGTEHLDYGGHDAHFEEDFFNKGEDKLIYDEKVVGHVPSQNNFEIVHDDESDRDYVYVDAYLYRDYGNYCCDILESRGGKTDVSAEVFTDQISFDADAGIVIVDKMRMSGITLLGEDILPAMKGANAAIFSLQDDDLQAQMIKVMSELNESLKSYSAVNGETTKGGNENLMDKFAELLEKYGKTAEDVTFEYAEMTDDELESAFEEAFGQQESHGEADDSGAEGFGQEESQNQWEAESNGDGDGNDDDEGEDDGDEGESGQEDETDFAKLSVNINGNVREYSVSLKDKLNALYELVNTTYEDDGTFYDVDVYDDDKYVIMVDYWTKKGYKQSYKVKKDVYTLVGDRVEVFATWLTQDEINKLDKMKDEYSRMEETLAHYEDEPKKLEILNSEDYSLIADNEEFNALKDQKNHFELSVEEVTHKADEILTKVVKAGKFSVDGKSISVRPLVTGKKKTRKFGSLFDGII